MTLLQQCKKTYEKESVTVVCQKGTMQVREDAKRAGVSTGIYMKQEKERLQQKQEENRKLEQTPTPQQETPKSQPVQQSEEKQKEVPLAPSNNANTVPPQQREIEQETEKAVDKGQQKKENKQDKQENVSTATKKRMAEIKKKSKIMISKMIINKMNIDRIMMDKIIINKISMIK
ncbi:hypothetical protein GCM10020331_041550 [Ectobacillus funiculus]